MTSEQEPSRGHICTFYSYKGGVGRSMALANVAVLLAQWGNRVLVVDWDLEAPGIERYFEDMVGNVDQLVRGRSGIIEIVDELSMQGRSRWRDSIIEFAVPGAECPLDFLSAGRRDSGYVERLQGLDWEALFRQHDFGARLEVIRNQWLEQYDHVLIDSRTGITDIGGICTIYLPDTLVAMFSANHQSVEGVADVISRARRARSDLPVDRGALVCVPVPARDESRTEYEQSAKWRNIYREFFSHFYVDFLPKSVSPVDALDLLRIPNVPFWSFGERLPVLTESASDPSSITYYYTLLAQLLATELSWQEVPSSQPSPSAGTVPMVRARPTPPAHSIQTSDAAGRLGGIETSVAELRAPLREQADDLAEVVRKQWEKETGLRGFHHEAQLLHVSWQPATEGFESWDDLIRTADENAAAKPSEWALTPAGLAGSDYRQICAVLDRIPTRRLVVLGQPGAGKTTLLIQLLQGLLERRRPGDAVPVLVSLASWRPAIEDLHTWLDRRLAIDYPILRARVPGQNTGRGRALLDEHKILLLLDGLDEIPTDERPEAIRRINRVLGDHHEGLVVACRTREYLEAAEPAAGQTSRPAIPLRAAAGILLQPLQPAEVAGYLQRGAPSLLARAEWEPVTSKLGPGTAVGEALTTPLNVTLAHASYNDPDWQRGAESVVSPVDLLTYPTAEKIEDHLYETFIKAAYRPDQGPYQGTHDKPPPPLDDAQRWLIFLAQKPGLAWWELRKAVSPWLAPLIVGLICGIAAAITSGTGAHVGVGIGIGIGAGMIAGLAMGLPFRFLSRESGSGPAKAAKRVGADGGKPVRADDIKPIRGVTGGLVGGILGGLAAGIAASHGFGHTASLVSGLPVALGVGVGAGATTTFIGGIAGGLSGGFTAALLQGVGTGLPAVIVNGVGITLVVAVIVALVGRDTPAAQRRWSWPSGLSGGLIIGGAAGIIAGFSENPVIGLILGAAVSATAAWPAGLLGIKVGYREIASPAAALSRDARAFWTTALSAGGAAAAFAFVGDGLASISAVHAKFSFPLLASDGLGVGLSAGVIVGFAFGVYHATSPSFLIARVWLSLRGELPWRFMAFLTDAHMQRGVLRENGAVYEFRHLEIEQYLARVGAKEAVRVTQAPSYGQFKHQ